MRKLYSEIGTLRDRIKKKFLPDHQSREYLVRMDLERVMFSARLLQISEFEFFRIAHVQWYSREIPEKSLEYIFDNYMFDDVVPHYVRHFARQVLLLFEEDRLDPRNFNIDRPRPSPELRSAGIAYTVLIFLVLAVFCLLISGHVPY